MYWFLLEPKTGYREATQFVNISSLYQKYFLEIVIISAINDTQYFDFWKDSREHEGQHMVLLVMEVMRISLAPG